MNIDSTSPKESQMMIYGWGKELAVEYKIGSMHQQRATLAFATEDHLIPLLIQHVKDKHGLTISHFHISDGTTTFAVGFDIVEDEYLTKFLLAR